MSDGTNRALDASRPSGEPMAEGRLVDSAGKLYAFTTTTCLVFTL